MPDQFDEAQRVTELQLQDALASHHRRVDEIRASHGLKNCEECGGEIPVKRRQAVPGCRLCVGCQRAFETTMKRG
jgi:phage/conjugal plasmid C-4 type zinc finger TraR family protein